MLSQGDSVELRGVNPQNSDMVSPRKQNPQQCFSHTGAVVKATLRETETVGLVQ